MRTIRRSITTSLAGGMAIALLLTLFTVFAPRLSDAAEKGLKVVIHNNEADTHRQEKALGNVRHIIEATNGDVDVIVVSHGGGLALVVADQTKHAKEVQ